MPTLALIVLYLALTMAPLCLAWMQGLPSRGFLDELASGLAIVALAIVLVEFVLSGRFRAISDRIGLDVTMRFHQLLARTAAVFLLVHPFLYQSLDGLPPPDEAAARMSLSRDPDGLVTGALAWVILMVVVVTALARKRLPYRYETWRAGHALAAVAVAGLGLHHTLVMGRYSDDPLLAGFWLTAGTVAIATLVFVYAVKPLLKRRRPYHVTSVERIGTRIWEVALSTSSGHPLRFSAGQFVWLSVGRSAFSPNENPFSIASAPGEAPNLRFVIKENGDFTGGIGGTAIGSRAYVDGPHGNLTVDDANGARGIALVAGGVGVAPMLSILRDLAGKRDPRPVVLLYGNRIEDQIIHRAELEALQEILDLRLEFVLSEPPADWTGRTGIPDARMVADVFTATDRERWIYLLCGPPPMMEAVEASLIALGVPARRILQERFDYD